MDVRPDLMPLSRLLLRLCEYSKAYNSFNREDWPHLKNNEDFSKVYCLTFLQRGPLESIYSDGRDLSVFMATRLVEFNDATRFPTLKAYADSFNGGWVDQISLLENDLAHAKAVAASVEPPIWAINQMLSLYSRQIDLLKATQQVVEALKGSDIYNWESNQVQNEVSTANYERVLHCIHLIGKMFERLPNTYAGKEEENLRDHILITLGAAIIGSVTGETFNRRGKTDILVRGTQGNEFVGECKFWRGTKSYLDAISQLLTYLSWRDDKAAVILFVENKEFSSVLEKIRSYTVRHPNYVKTFAQKDETWLNYEFRSNEDSCRLVSIAVMAYHIPPISS